MKRLYIQLDGKFKGWRLRTNKKVGGSRSPNGMSCRSGAHDSDVYLIVHLLSTQHRFVDALRTVAPYHAACAGCVVGQMQLATHVMSANTTASAQCTPSRHVNSSCNDCMRSSQRSNWFTAAVERGKVLARSFGEPRVVCRLEQRPVRSRQSAPFGDISSPLHRRMDMGQFLCGNASSVC